MSIYKVKSKREFLDQVKEGDITLARMIIRTILHNLTSKNTRHIITQVEFEDNGESYELSCHSDEFILTLEKNLQVLIDAEAYEECSKVAMAIRYLKNNKSYDIQI